MKLLFDTDLLIYQTCSMLTYNQETVPPMEHFFYVLKNKIAKHTQYLSKTFHIDGCEHFITAKDHSNFRYNIEIDPPYKANRAEQEIPKGFYECVEYMVKYHNAIIVTGMEADDEIGIRCSSDPCCTIRISEKDLRMIPGWHVDISDKFPSPIFVTDPGHLIWCRNKRGTGYVIGWGIKWFWFQMLVGDRADGVKGVPGLGEKKAYEILYDVHTLEEMEDIVYNQYEKLNLEKNFEPTKQLLWIKRER